MAWFWMFTSKMELLLVRGVACSGWLIRSCPVVDPFGVELMVYSRLLDILPDRG